MSAKPVNHIIGRTPDSQAVFFQQGNEDALAFFFSEFYPALAKYASQWVENRSIAEEVASEAFIQTWKMHHKLGNYHVIRAYLYKTVQRASQRALHQEKRRKEIARQSQPELTTNDTPYHCVVRSEVYRLIHSSLKDLSPATRKVLIMHYLEGKTTGEIATELHLSPSTIKTQKTKGLETLRKKLLRSIPILFSLLLITFFRF